jgi:hypothetical protein
MTSPFGEWYLARCVRDADAVSSERALFADYRVWVTERGHPRLMSSRGFADALQQRQHVLAGRGTDGEKLRSGVRFRQPDDPSPEPSRDDFHAWSSARLVVAPDYKSPRRELREDYLAWCSQHGLAPSLTPVGFHRAMAVFGDVHRDEHGQVSRYAGVRLRTALDRAPEAPASRSASSDPHRGAVRRALSALLRSCARAIYAPPPAPRDRPDQGG